MNDSDADPTLTRPIRLVAPEGVGPFLVERFSGNEGLSRLFEYELDLLSEDLEVDFSAIMGQPVALIVEGDEDRPNRVVHGHVARFTQSEARGRHMQYCMTIVPFVWFLTRVADCRIFQEKSVPEIVREVLSQRGFDEIDDRLTATYPKWEYCVQYRETDFNFISRLLEHEGIYYYFEHEQDGDSGDFKHKLVLCDAPSNHTMGEGCAGIPFGRFLLGAEHVDSVNDWSVMNHVHSDQSTLVDFDFKQPKKQLRSGHMEMPEYTPPPGEIYDFPGGFITSGEGDRLAQVRAEQHSLRRTIHRGSTDARGLFAGVQFGLEGHPREDQNKSYLVISSTHSGWCDVGEAGAGGRGGGGGEHVYSCTFEAIDASVQYRPLRTTPKPVVQGPQTAMVVGPSGEEIHTDEFGRVRVLFHWDRLGDPSKGDCSCWIRVAQLWAGKKWGAMYLPRVGHEVIVEFLEGDPDRPIVTGRVYNGDAKPPYDLPANKTVSTLKSNSSKGGAGFNELRFEDKKGSEQIFLHGEKDLEIRIKSDRREFIGHDRHLVVEHDKFEKVKNERHDVVESHHYEEIKGDRHLEVTGMEAKQVKGSLNLSVTGDVNEEFSANHTEETTASLKVKAMDITLEGMMLITLKVGGTKIEIGPSGVTVTAPSITLNGPVTMSAVATVSGALTVGGPATVGGPVTSGGPVTASAIVSPTYTPGAGNIL